jgi:hypothetical protein
VVLLGHDFLEFFNGCFFHGCSLLNECLGNGFPF